ncbi:uroporphyrinogen III methyltransferase/synthase [Clostridium punense]|uniref:uroporphyrinogen-III C-methyltransferase n=1 Tax=Clostridium punense TaxID=1054297 RepID=A0ABS4K1G3_9CLOT|nr:uroporphyrinogen-III C-methyltransferase [Clostridium punense]MBP2021614.1 uroporphyrinogen III methyltransferase/synthase [Clostridium punense]
MSKVYLIGGGPGNEDLITLKAIKVLKKCTAIMYDRLSGEGILKYVNKDAVIYYCGKEPGSHYKTQDEINEMLITLAKQGHTVGRVKGGDPYIFGRGGEEALALLKENIGFEVVPGITSPISVLNYGGIPVTHRKIAQSFHIFTGKSVDKLNLDFSVIAKLKGTLIFMMSFENLERITSELINNGMDEKTPAAVVMWGTTAKQKKAVGNIGNIGVLARERGLGNPAIIVVGEVVNFQDKLNWFEKKPLFGRNICITRTKEQSEELSEKLKELGAEVTEINSIKIKEAKKSIEPFLERLEQYQYIVITSVNAANNFFDALMENNIDTRTIKGRFVTIGPASDKAVRMRGIVPFLSANEFVSEKLFEVMEPFLKEGDKVLLPRSKNGRPYMVEALTDAGCEVDDCHIYETVLGENNNLGQFKEVDTVIFTSPSTVKNMITLVGLEAIREKKVISIGPITSKELQRQEISFVQCEESCNDGIVKQLLKSTN